MGTSAYSQVLFAVGFAIVILANLPRRFADPFGRHRWTAIAVGGILAIAGFVLGGGKLGHTGGGP